MSVRWKDKADITALAADDRMPVTDVSDSNVDKYTTPAEIATYVASLNSYQPLDSDLTAIAALTTTAYGRALLALADAAALRDTAGLDTDDFPTFSGVGIGGATADATNRLSANTPAVLFNRETDDIQVKLNKEAAGDTASFLFQTGFSGRAEIGTIGDDNFQFKVSPDGAVFTTGIQITASDASVQIPVRIEPDANDGAALGSATVSWSDLFGASGFTVNIANGNWVATHTSGILTVGTGDLRVTNAGADTASVVTVGGAQTLTNKTLTSPTLTTPALGTPASGTLTNCTGLPAAGVTGLGT